MTRYIDADALKELWQPDHNRKFDADYFIHTIDNAPTADVVEVVRCENCKWWDGEKRNGFYYFETCSKTGLDSLSYDYCSHGERREIDV